MSFKIVIMIVGACASLAAAACWGATVAFGILLTKDVSAALQAERRRTIAQWIVRGSVFTAAAALCEAASDIYTLLR